MPEIGTILVEGKEADRGEEVTEPAKADDDLGGGMPAGAIPMPSGMGSGGGIKLPGGKMAFALITKSKKSSKFSVQKISMDSSTSLVMRTQERMA